MFVIEQAHWLATQEILIETRKQPVDPRRNEWLTSGPVYRDDNRPTRASSLDQTSEALERKPDSRIDGHDGEVRSPSDSEGPIVETPMGVVRPWPRIAKREERRGLNTFDVENSLSNLGKSVSRDELPLMRSSEPPVERGEPSAEDAMSSTRDNDGNDISSSLSEAPITETPMGVVKPTRRWPKKEKLGAGRHVDTRTPPAKPSIHHRDRGVRLVRKASTEPHLLVFKNGQEGKGGDSTRKTRLANGRAVRPESTRSWSERNGQFRISLPATRPGTGDGTNKTGGLPEEPPTMAHAGDTPLANDRKSAIGAAFKSIVDKFLTLNQNSTQRPPPAETGMLGHLHYSPTSSSAKRSKASVITEINDLHKITTLTLLTEDVHGLTTFYLTVFGATLTSSSMSSTTLRFTPQLSIRVLNSIVARDRGTFGEDVIVGRQAAMPKRVLLSFEVRDVEAVWRRLRDLGHGQQDDDGQEALGEARIVGRTRRLCFVDLAGHCWEAWQVMKEDEGGDGDQVGQDKAQVMK